MIVKLIFFAVMIQMVVTSRVKCLSKIVKVCHLVKLLNTSVTGIKERSSMLISSNTQKVKKLKSKS